MSFVGNDDDKTRGIWETQVNKQEFFTATKNFVANPENAQYVQTLNDPNASLEQKQQAQQVLVNNIAAQMKVDPAVVLQVMTRDEQNSPTKGGYINGGDTLYVNGGLHDTIQDEANTVGHEMQHYLDDKAGTTAGNETAKQNLEYFADTMGNATEDFLGFNYVNLTDTTFGGDINHTASTHAPGSGVLLDTNTNQFNHAKEQGELENRMPPNAFGVDWSNMDSGGIQAQADTNQAVAYVDSVMKDNATSKEAVADYAGITTGIGSCLTLAGCGAGLTNAAIAFSDLGEVLSQGISVNPVDNDPIQKGVISIMPDFVGKDQSKKLASDIVLGLPTVKSLIDINKSISKSEAIMDSVNKSLDILSIDVLHDTIKSDLNEVDGE